jgi:inner membrane protein
MSSPIAHTLGAYAVLVTLEPGLVANRRLNGIALGAAFVFGNLADADFVVEHFTSNPFWRHHYFTHSIPFALLIGIAAYLILKIANRRYALRDAALVCGAYASHLLMDYFTDDGSKPYGIPLFLPFTHTHFMIPFPVFYSIHRGELSDLFSAHNLIGVSIELAVMGPIAYFAAFVAHQRLENRGGEPPVAQGTDLRT